MEYPAFPVDMIPVRVSEGQGIISAWVIPVVRDIEFPYLDRNLLYAMVGGGADPETPEVTLDRIRVASAAFLHIMGCPYDVLPICTDDLEDLCLECYHPSLLRTGPLGERDLHDAMCLVFRVPLRVLGQE